ncbi:MAG TPA: hypothetical protein VK452_01985 [Dissulfurispiraceae bacterium]|nr:hypothetical protein [Dissulfurispiraceae bacterium]
MSRKVKMTAAKAEKRQQKIDADILSDVFPKVKHISINMTYNQTGVLEPLSRAINYYPGSAAIFRMHCLCSDCVEGGFEFSKIIKSMVKARKTVLKGKIGCDSCSSPECADVSYIIQVKYF